MAVRFVHAHIQGLAEHTLGRSVHMGHCGSSVVVVSSVLLLPVESSSTMWARGPRQRPLKAQRPTQRKRVLVELLRIFYAYRGIFYPRLIGDVRRRGVGQGWCTALKYVYSFSVQFFVHISPHLATGAAARIVSYSETFTAGESICAGGGLRRWSLRRRLHSLSGTR